MLIDLARGAGFMVRGFAMLRRPRIRRLAAAPFAAAIAALGAAVWAGAALFSRLLDWLLGTIPTWLQWLEPVLWVLFAVGAAAAFVVLFGAIASLASSPFNGPLAAAVEELATGRAPPSASWGETVRGAPRMLLGEAAKVVYTLGWTGGALVLFLIPGINVAAPALWLLCAAWVTAFSFSDYGLANHGVGLRRARQLLRRRWGAAIGFGGAALLCFAVPLLNLLAVPAAVCGGTLLAVHVRR